MIPVVEWWGNFFVESCKLSRLCTSISFIKPHPLHDDAFAVAVDLTSSSIMYK